MTKPQMNEGPILVVDDVASMRNVVRTCLNQIGYQDVDEAADGEAALAMMARRDYAWVLSDWHMAPLGGADLLRRVKSEVSHAPRFVFLTMDGDWNVMSDARSLGAVRLIVKPVRTSALKASIESVLKAA